MFTRTRRKEQKAEGELLGHDELQRGAARQSETREKATDDDRACTAALEGIASSCVCRAVTGAPAAAVLHVARSHRVCCNHALRSSASPEPAELPLHTPSVRPLQLQPLLLPDHPQVFFHTCYTLRGHSVSSMTQHVHERPHTSF